MIDKILPGVERFVAMLRVIAAVLLTASVALNFVNVVARYFFNFSIFWAEEVMLYLMVGCVFLGNGPVAWSGRQLRMDVLVHMTPPPIQRALNVMSELVLVIVCLLIAVFAAPVIRDLTLFDQRSQSAEIPMVIPQVMVPLGLTIMAILVLIRLWMRSAGREPADHTAAL